MVVEEGGVAQAFQCGAVGYVGRVFGLVVADAAAQYHDGLGSGYGRGVEGRVHFERPYQLVCCEWRTESAEQAYSRQQQYPCTATIIAGHQNKAQADEYQQAGRQ